MPFAQLNQQAPRQNEQRPQIIQPGQPRPVQSIPVQPLPTTTSAPRQKKELSRTFIIVLVSISLLILVGAAILGLYWDRFF